MDVHSSPRVGEGLVIPHSFEWEFPSEEKRERETWVVVACGGVGGGLRVSYLLLINIKRGKYLAGWIMEQIRREGP